MSRYKFIFILLVGLLFSNVQKTLAEENLSIKTDSIQLRIYFKQGSSFLNPLFHENEERIDSFVNQIRKMTADTINTLQEIEITASASPEGTTRRNNKLCELRSNAVCQYLMSSLNQPKSKFKVTNLGEDWQGLREMVQKKGIPHYQEVVNIIDNVPEYVFKNGVLVDGRKKRLMDLNYGRVWLNMLREFNKQVQIYNKLL